MNVRIITSDGWKLARCIWRRRGLAVTKAYNATGWALTVVGQGRSLGSLTTSIASPRKAIALASVLAAGVDWRRVRDPIPNDHQGELGGFVRATLEMFEVIPS